MYYTHLFRVVGVNQAKAEKSQAGKEEQERRLRRVKSSPEARVMRR